MAKIFLQSATKIFLKSGNILGSFCHAALVAFLIRVKLGISSLLAIKNQGFIQIDSFNTFECLLCLGTRITCGALFTAGN